MSVEGKPDTMPVLRLRNHIGEGSLGDHEVSISNLFDGSVSIEFKDKPTVIYKSEDMVKDAWELVKNKEKPDWNKTGNKKRGGVDVVEMKAR